MMSRDALLNWSRAQGRKVWHSSCHQKGPKSTGTKKCGCPFQLKGLNIGPGDEWKVGLYVEFITIIMLSILKAIHMQGVLWNMLVLVKPEVDYERNLHEMDRIFEGKYSKTLDYVKVNWLKEYKDRFVAVWIDTCMHFGNTTSNRAESAHSKLKRQLSTSQCNFKTSWAKIHAMLVLKHIEIKASFERSQSFVQHEFNKVSLLKDLIGFEASSPSPASNHHLSSVLSLLHSLCLQSKANSLKAMHQHKTDDNLRYVGGPVFSPPMPPFPLQLMVKLTKFCGYFVDLRCQFPEEGVQNADANGDCEKKEDEDDFSFACTNLEGSPISAKLFYNSEGTKDGFTSVQQLKNKLSSAARCIETHLIEGVSHFQMEGPAYDAQMELSWFAYSVPSECKIKLLSQLI
ncbi:unnamed protein product [Prunus armeniaca]